MNNPLKAAFLTLALVALLAAPSPAPAHAAGRVEPAAPPDMPLPNLIQFASTDINNFWRLNINASRRNYYVPNMVPYTQPINTPCGTAVLNNAFYCPPANTIYYDYNFLSRSYHNVGDYAAVGIIAHEWGHLVQAHLGISRGNAFSIQMELQADCFAGAYTLYAEQTGKLDPGDLDEAGEDLFRSGDRRGTPWFDPQAHGSSLQRIRSFVRGYERGAQACFN